MTFWTIIGAVFSVVCPTIGAAVFVIKLIIAKEISNMETSIMKHIQETYVTKEVHHLMVSETERRFTGMEMHKSH